MMNSEQMPPQDEPYEPEAIDMVARLIMRKIADSMMEASAAGEPQENPNADQEEVGNLQAEDRDSGAYRPRNG